MPKPIRFTVEYQVTRSRDFQSVKHGVSMEYELLPGESEQEAFRSASEGLAVDVDAFADRQIAAALVAKNDRSVAPTVRNVPASSGRVYRRSTPDPEESDPFAE